MGIGTIGKKKILMNKKKFLFFFLVGPLFASLLLNRLHIMMTTMLTVTVFTLIAIFFVIKRLRPLAKQTPLENLKDLHK